MNIPSFAQFILDKNEVATLEEVRALHSWTSRLPTEEQVLLFSGTDPCMRNWLQVNAAMISRFNDEEQAGNLQHQNKQLRRRIVDLQSQLAEVERLLRLAKEELRLAKGQPQVHDPVAEVFKKTTEATEEEIETIKQWLQASAANYMDARLPQWLYRNKDVLKARTGRLI